MRSHGRARVKLGVCTLLLVFAAAGGAQAQVMSLEQALALAYETNPRLDAERATVRAADEDVARALSGYRPSASLSGSYGYAEDDTGNPFAQVPSGHPRDVTVTLAQPLFNGTTMPLTRQANAAVRAARARLTSVEQLVLLSAARAYFDVVADEAAVRFQRENVMLLGEQLDATQQRANIGDLTVTDVQLVRARLSAANADLAFAQARLIASRAAFERAVGRPAETLETAPRLPGLPPDREQALQRAEASNPDLAAAREDARAADAAVAAAIGTLLPNLSVQGQYRNSTDQVAAGINSQASSVIAQLRVPIYQAGEEYASVRKAKENRIRATLAISDVDRQVRQGVQTAWQAQVAAREALGFHEQGVAAAQEAYEGFVEGARAGERTTFDVVNAAQEIISAQIALADARRQYYIASYQLSTAMGDLTARGLNLPVQLYDPQVHYDRNAGKWVGFE